MDPSIRRLIEIVTVAALASGGGSSTSARDAPDQSLKVIQTTEIRVKDTLDPDVPSTGEVRLAVLVDETGKLHDVLLIGSSHRTYTEAAVAGLQEWRFEPARKHGQPVGVRTTVRIFFHSHGRVVSVTGGELLAGLVNNAFRHGIHSRLAEADELDVPLRAIQSVRPRFPTQALRGLTERPSVLIDFYVDEDGRPRMPVIVRGENPHLSVAALEAIEQWRFDPPTRAGTPVIVRVQQEFVFFESATSDT